jgi:hypothetical protein
MLTFYRDRIRGQWIQFAMVMGLYLEIVESLSLKVERFAMVGKLRSLLVYRKSDAGDWETGRLTKADGEV